MKNFSGKRQEKHVIVQAGGNNLDSLGPCLTAFMRGFGVGDLWRDVS